MKVRKLWGGKSLYICYNWELLAPFSYAHGDVKFHAGTLKWHATSAKMVKY